jgi:hypothetical protein
MSKSKKPKAPKHTFPKAIEEQPATKPEPLNFFYCRSNNKIVRSAKSLPEPDYTGPCPTFLGLKKMMKIELKARESDLRSEWKKIRAERLNKIETI